MINSFDQDLINGFREQIYELENSMQNSIELCKNTSSYHNTVDELFRSFHSLKSVCAYLNFEEAHKLAAYAEKILHVMRNSEGTLDEGIFEWLALLHEQIQDWHNDMELGIEELSAVNENIFTLLRLASIKENPKAILKRMSLLVVIGNHKLRNALSRKFKGYFHTIYVARNAAEANEIFNSHIIQLVISQYTLPHEDEGKNTLIMTGKNGLSMYKEFNKTVPMLMVLDEPDSQVVKELSSLGISFLTKPLRLGSIYAELIDMANLFYANATFDFNTMHIQKQIQKIEPLSDSLQEVQKICDDDECSISDLSRVLKSDPILAAMILKEASSAFYAMENIDSVERAVSFFGKQTVKALSMLSTCRNFDMSLLSIYKLSHENFLKISSLRMQLLTRWYSSLYPKDLNVLTSSITMAHMGMLILAQQIQDKKCEDEFMTLVDKYDILEAEVRLMDIHSIDLTADLMYHWGLNRRLIDIIRFSENLSYAPDNIRPLCFGIHIVNAIIPHNFSKLASNLNENIIMEIEKEGMEVQVLENALTMVNVMQNRL